MILSSLKERSGYGIQAKLRQQSSEPRRVVNQHGLEDQNHDRKSGSPDHPPIHILIATRLT